MEVPTMAAQTWELRCEEMATMVGAERKLNELLARRAADGWDLVCATQATTHYTLYFRRPVT
jgi:hypothetical protein